MSFARYDFERTFRTGIWWLQHPINRSDTKTQRTLHTLWSDSESSIAEGLFVPAMEVAPKDRREI
jgi:hypothetical protein